MINTFPSLTAALDAIMARGLAISVASFLRGHAAGDYDAEMRDELIRMAIKAAPGQRERIRQDVIAKHRANGKGVPDDWGMTPDEPLNDLTSVEIGWPTQLRLSEQLRKPTDLATAEIMGVA